MASIDAVWYSRKIAKLKKTFTTAKVAGILNMATDCTKEKANASNTIIEQHALYGANCSECPFQAECAVKGKRRKITSDDYEAERRRMAAKVAAI